MSSTSDEVAVETAATTSTTARKRRLSAVDAGIIAIVLGAIGGLLSRDTTAI
jgi:hypothetical protein